MRKLDKNKMSSLCAMASSRIAIVCFVGNLDL